MKFKIGEKVKVREDLEIGKMYGGTTLYREMNTFRGKICSIEEYYKKGNDYKLDNGWWFNEDMLESINENTLKVGDKVIIRDDLKRNSIYGEELFTISMEKFKGKEVTISKIVGNHYELLEDIWKFFWSIEMFEPQKSEEGNFQATITINGDSTMVRTKDSIGISWCNPEDEYNKGLGIAIALFRALDIDTNILKPKELKDYSNEELLKEIESRL